MKKRRFPFILGLISLIFGVALAIPAGLNNNFILLWVSGFLVVLGAILFYLSYGS